MTSSVQQTNTPQEREMTKAIKYVLSKFRKVDKVAETEAALREYYRNAV